MNKKQQAFSLIELLVVIAIIGILATIGSITYNQYIAIAKKNVSLANYKNVVQYVQIVGQLTSSGIDKTGGLAQGDLTTSNNIANAISTKMRLEITNPWTQNPAISATSTFASCDQTNQGSISLKDNINNIIISSCFASDAKAVSKTIRVK